MKPLQDGAIFALRLAIAINFGSALASRLGGWGAPSSGWQNFLAYTAELNAFAPASRVPVLAGVATGLEGGVALLLLIGYQIRRAALTGAFLTLLFALAMSYSFGSKAALDYSVWVDCAAAFLLATMPAYRWSLDAYFLQKQSNSSIQVQ